MNGAGALRDRLTVQQKSTVADGRGGRAVTWAALATVWAAIAAVGAGETIQAAALGATQSHVVSIRYRTDITPLMRVVWTPYLAGATKTLEIHGVQLAGAPWPSRAAVQGTRRYLWLHCAEVA